MMPMNGEDLARVALAYVKARLVEDDLGAVVIRQTTSSANLADGLVALTITMIGADETALDRVESLLDRANRQAGLPPSQD